MKKFLGILIFCVAVSVSSGVFLSADAAEIEDVYVNGQVLEIDESQTPYIKNDRTMIPLRAVSEAMNATVYWFDDDKSIQIVRYDTTLTLQIDNNIMKVYQIIDNEFTEVGETELDAPPELGDESRGYRTFVPFRAIAEALGAKIDAEIVSGHEGEYDAPMNIVLEDDFYETKDINTVTVMDLYNKAEVENDTLVSVDGTIVRIEGQYYLQDLENPAYMVSLSSIPDVADYWTQQLGVESNDPNGIRVNITGIVELNEYDAYTIPMRRTVTGIRPLAES